MLNILFVNACILIAIISMVFQAYHNQKNSLLVIPYFQKLY